VTGGHPLNVTRRDSIGNAGTIAVGNDASKHVGHRFNASMRMHGETRKVVWGFPDPK
jgi:hypothetical protein